MDNVEAKLNMLITAYNVLVKGIDDEASSMSHNRAYGGIITLLKGERKVDRPIHKAEFFKELRMSELKKAVALFAEDLKKYAR